MGSPTLRMPLSVKRSRPVPIVGSAQNRLWHQYLPSYFGSRYGDAANARFGSC